ncbi:cytochrome c oxidase subunit 4 [Phaeacidiphilus oryzae]|uniref:cytochrome c oxidase subunit 4 n=1 Tax=Phaeacidiphilus oryzae TaxID=348818 RepID=UPI00055BCA67|nr:cytochrome c oxidase subunit 4 [Phaeacidiphilus oryzae]
MKTETWLFGAIALFFACVTPVYGYFSHDPAGTAVLGISFGMAGLITFFLLVQHRRGAGGRPSDRKDAQVVEGAGELGFFAPTSGWPIAIAFGAMLVAAGVAFGVWLMLIGAGILVPSVAFLVIQYSRG